MAFDFHSMCANLKWDRLSLLIKDLQPYQSSYSYFMKTTNGGIISRQLGTFRVNCMDSLDRWVIKLFQSKVMLYVPSK